MRHHVVAAARRLAAVCIVGAVCVSCSGVDRSTEAFCEQLQLVTGPDGAEVAFTSGDPARLDGIVTELNTLLDRAPDDIATTTATIVDFFESYQRTPLSSRRDLLAANETSLIEASADLDQYALNQCGVFLQRVVPTPRPTVDPGIEVLPE